MMIDARTTEEAHAGAQKLCDTINAKNKQNKAWIPMIVKDPRDKK